MRRWLIAVVLIAACSKSSPPASLDAGPQAVAPMTTAPSLQHYALLRYEGFSADGLVFAYAEAGPAGPQLQWLSATTNTIEKTFPLTTGEERDAAMAALKEEHFPQVGTVGLVPSQVSATLRNGQVQVLFGAMPGGRPFKPFRDKPDITPRETQVVAVSKDGKRAAVRTSGGGGDAGASVAEYRVVSLFE